ncbi:MAG: hypothetical protein A3G39_10475 [Deltaproteobacteria bacterium RIFCSPLOWO2_12_FULL_43_16]|nr:MAG: hypothetical protein A2Z89_00610 [Deltaproteobacteria bacterium GWA2_43_19]OGQ09182.1 MAG: hypothetical protein A3D30_09335 [Deltaproteobacteria bacterium RIFCSPHIGHO2_02_FULL_43_33]OGQ61702.1 MAG: hypothetical protein A3G39_10475 [Deltaproteobacteria bacterium RIFCSPLOWO2_12_FULL_43_16]HBR17643.1 disulfide oxidoreductase [Deltaproteobacteria bacterium]
MKITKDMIVEDVLTKYPETLNVFVKQGHCFGLLSNVVARKSLAKLVTIETACKLHFINLEKLVKELNEVVEKKG